MGGSSVYLKIRLHIAETCDFAPLKTRQKWKNRISGHIAQEVNAGEVPMVKRLCSGY